MTTSPCELWLSFRDGVRLLAADRGDDAAGDGNPDGGNPDSGNPDGGTDVVVVALNQPRLRLPGLLAGVRAALASLAPPGVPRAVLADRVSAATGGAGRPALDDVLDALDGAALLEHRIAVGDATFATVYRMVGGETAPPRPVGGGPVRISRFAYCRRGDSGWVLESPLSPVRCRLSATAVEVVSRLAEPTTVPELLAGLPGPGLAAAAELLIGFLVAAGIAGFVGADGGLDGDLEEDRSVPLAQWEFHDLVFHARSRMGRHDHPFGGYFPFAGRIPPLPAVTRRERAAGIELPVPDLTAALGQDGSLVRAMETRRSLRAHGAAPITDAQLGEFLYRVARVCETHPVLPDDPESYEFTRRPYPSGGRCHDLEHYLIIDRCRGIPRGTYHYDPAGHRLELVAEPSPLSQGLLDQAQGGALLPTGPQVLIVLASRFQRVSWKYQSIAYALTLKHVGVLMGTMYLVATSMGLAPCAVGAGDSDAFARLVGTDYYAETSVGEFVLGSRDPGE